MLAKISTLITLVLLSLTFASAASAATYYIAPDACDPYHTSCNPSLGNDNNPGTASQPWKTFAKTWPKLTAGDTLTLLNGVYYQVMSPTARGTASSPVTIKALNDGMAVVDAQFGHRAFDLSGYMVGNQPVYQIIEGINFRNAMRAVNLNGIHYLTFRRIHAYNQFYELSDLACNDHSCEPQHPIRVGSGSTNILIEDCIASGNGSKMLKVIKSNATVRRCITDWRWVNSYFDHNLWPWAGGLNIYHNGGSIFENVISLGNSNTYAINFHGLERDKDPNDPNQSDVSNNKYLGSIALNQGYTMAGDIYSWSPYRPQPNNVTHPTKVWNYSWAGKRTGFSIGGNIKDTLFQDILAFNNAGVGYYRSYEGTNYSSNTRIVNSTFAGNHDKITSGHPNDGPLGTNANLHKFGSDMSITNSYIQNSTYKGAGADITKRYIDGVKTNQNLWPWPMEQRVRAELGYSITQKVAHLTQDLNSKGHLTYTISPPSDNPTFPLPSTSTTFIQFDTTAAGSTNSKTFVVRNVGNAPLIIDRFRMVDDFKENTFTITNTGVCAPTNHTLDPGQSCTLTVRFAPGNREFYTGRIAVYPKNMGQANHPEIVSLLGLTSGGTFTPTPTSTSTPTNTPTPSITEGLTPTPGETDQYRRVHLPLDEGSGTTAYDSSGYNNHGALHNDPYWMDGKYGSALYFVKELNSNVRVSANSSINDIFDNGGTVAFWVYPGGLTGQILNKQDGASGWYITYQAIADSGRVRLTQRFTDNNISWSQSEYSIPHEDWTHVAITYNNSSTSDKPMIYINGVEVEVANPSSPPSGTRVSDAATPLTLGHNYHRNQTSNAFDGGIDDLKLYTKELSSSEVILVMNNQSISTKPGDANGDGKVDGLDYVIWLNNYGTTTTGGASKGDFNGDTKVDGLDYVIWLNNYGS
jgi:hypothetical protein